MCRPGASPEDQTRLKEIRDAIVAEKNVDAALLPDALIGLLGASAGCELGPVAAVVGGMLAAELIKAASLKDKPHNNFFCFDGHTMEGRVVTLE
jgi:ubiquitin-like 1-activating enzyme E1 A